MIFSTSPSVHLSQETLPSKLDLNNESISVDLPTAVSPINSYKYTARLMQGAHTNAKNVEIESLCD